MNIKPAPSIDYQFGDEYDPAKMRSLIQKLQAMQKTLNMVVTLINTGQITVTQTTPPTPNP